VRDSDADRSLRVLTWNVDGLNESRLGQRMETICLEILIGGDLHAALEGARTPPMPDVVALQEVVRVAHRGYFAPHFSAAGFSLWPAEAPDDREHYELIAVRPPWVLEHCERRPLEPSPLGRACTVATLRHGASGRRLTALTAHLESLRSGREARLAQVAQIEAWMREAGTPAVFAGDTNLRDAEWRALAPERSPRDAFEELGSPPDARATWWPEEDARGFRFDRVWLAGPVRARTLSLRHRPRASDHDAVEVCLELSDGP
jgi:tyrosyl-DNA phosphodiesterase 2